MAVTIRPHRVPLLPVIVGLQAPEGMHAAIWPAVHPGPPLTGGVDAAVSKVTYCLSTHGEDAAFVTSRSFRVPGRLELGADEIRVLSDPLTDDLVRPYLGSRRHRFRRRPELRAGLRVPTSAVFRVNGRRPSEDQLVVVIGVGVGHYDCEIELVGDGGREAARLGQAVASWTEHLASTIQVEQKGGTGLVFPVSIPVPVPAPSRTTPPAAPAATTPPPAPPEVAPAPAASAADTVFDDVAVAAIERDAITAEMRTDLPAGGLFPADDEFDDIIDLEQQEPAQPARAYAIRVRRRMPG